MGKTATFAERLKELLTLKHITQAELSRRSGVGKSSITHYIKGDWEGKQDAVYAIAKATNVEYAWLMGHDVPMEAQAPSNAIPYEPTGVRPVVGRIAAGAPVVAVEDIEGYEPVDVPDPENYYWLRVEGRSMINAGILPGDLALIRMQNCADNGNIVACRVNGDEATLKRFEQQGDTVFLLPENTDPEYKKYIIPVKEFETGYAAILGVLVETKRKY